MVFTVTQMSLSLSVHCITAHTVAFTYYISSWEVGHILCTSIAGSLRTARQREDRCRVRPNIWYCSSAGMIDRDLIEWERKYLFALTSKVGSSIERRKSRSELKVEGVCLWMNQYVDGNCPQRQAMLQSARWQWSMKDELRNCKRKYTTIHSSFVYVGALAVQPTESTKWKLVIELPAVFELEVSKI